MINLTPQQKKEYLLQKYVKREYKVEDIDACKKYVVYFNPSIEKVKEWQMICVTSSLEEARKEIAWKLHSTKFNDMDIVLDHDKNFSTYRNELLNVNEQGLVYEPTDKDITHDYNSSGNMLQVIANSAPPANNNAYRGLAYYTNFSIDYKGFYKIEEIFEI